MADTSNTQSQVSLGVGGIVADSFSILFKNFVKVMILGFVPGAIGLIISGMLNGWDVALGLAVPGFASGGAIGGFVIGLLVQLALYGITIALLVQLAYDTKLGRPVSIGRYFGPALSAAIPITILGLVIGVLAGLGTLALLLPGLWIYAVYSVTAPVIVIEKAGFGGMGRSAALTKEYRWPILGAVILVGICSAVINFIGLYIAGFFGAIGVVALMLVTAALTAVAYGLSGISIALIYARLREIKEGVGVDELASVFD